MHLVYLIHGLFGNPGHLKSIEASLRSQLGEDVVVKRARAMSAVGTFDGVEVNAKQLEVELLSLIQETKATHLSIVGYSMGGLCGRYLIGLLEEKGLLGSAGQTSGDRLKIEPVLFATFATPHAGTPQPSGSLFATVFNFVGPVIAGRSGPDLFGTSDLLAQMADPTEKYYRGLQKFPNLFLFANTTRDRTVPFWTAFITSIDPFRRRGHIDLRRFPSNQFFIDMLGSKWRAQATKRPRLTLKQWLTRLLVYTALPPFLLLLMLLMTGVTTFTFVRRLIRQLVHRPLGIRSHRSHIGDELLASVGGAMDEALDLTDPQNLERDGSRETPSSREATSSRGTPSTKSKSSRGTPSTKSSTGSIASLDVFDLGVHSPGYEGLIADSANELNLNQRTLTIIENLNHLPWRKFAVRLPSLNAHGIIVDRNNRQSEGKEVVDAFAAMFQHVNEHRKKSVPKL